MWRNWALENELEWGQGYRQLGSEPWLTISGHHSKCPPPSSPTQDMSIVLNWIQLITLPEIVGRQFTYGIKSAMQSRDLRASTWWFSLFLKLVLSFSLLGISTVFTNYWALCFPRPVINGTRGKIEIRNVLSGSGLINR